MSKKLLSEEEVQTLRLSPYTESVSTRSVTFTPEFKRIMYDELLKGKKVDTILEERGIDSSVLGECRLKGICEKLYKTAEREEGFANLKKQKRPRDVKEKEETLEKQIRQLKAELAYTRQEVEFLKKVQQADTEARISWESKRRLK